MKKEKRKRKEYKKNPSNMLNINKKDIQNQFQDDKIIIYVIVLFQMPKQLSQWKNSRNNS